MTPIISIVGKSGSGKTTLIEKTIRELKQRGYKVGTIKHINNSENIDSLEAYFPDMDIVLTEGFKEDKKPKIEVFRSSVHKTPLCISDNSLMAIVTDTKVDTDVPVFGLEEIKELTDFITETFLPDT
jgi:molybdopterin-guanine dinucleotide biosynthesis protein B